MYQGLNDDPISYGIPGFHSNEYMKRRGGAFNFMKDLHNMGFDSIWHYAPYERYYGDGVGAFNQSGKWVENLTNYGPSDGAFGGIVNDMYNGSSHRTFIGIDDPEKMIRARRQLDNLKNRALAETSFHGDSAKAAWSRFKSQYTMDHAGTDVSLRSTIDEVRRRYFQQVKAVGDVEYTPIDDIIENQIRIIRNKNIKITPEGVFKGGEDTLGFHVSYDDTYTQIGKGKGTIGDVGEVHHRRKPGQHDLISQTDEALEPETGFYKGIASYVKSGKFIQVPSEMSQVGKGTGKFTEIKTGEYGDEVWNRTVDWDTYRKAKKMIDDGEAEIAKLRANDGLPPIDDLKAMEIEQMAPHNKSHADWLSWKRAIMGILSVRGPRWLRHVGLEKIAAPEPTAERVYGISEHITSGKDAETVKSAIDTFVKDLGKLKPDLDKISQQITKNTEKKTARVVSAWKKGGRISRLMGAMQGNLTNHLGKKGKLFFPKAQRVRIEKTFARVFKSIFDQMDQEYEALAKAAPDPRLDKLRRLIFEQEAVFQLDSAGNPLKNVKERENLLKQIEDLTFELQEKYVKELPMYSRGHKQVSSVLDGVLDLTTAKIGFFDFWNEGIIPTRYEIQQLKHIFGPEFAGSFAKHRSNTLANYTKRILLKNILGFDQKQVNAISAKMSWFSDMGSYTPMEILRESATLPKTAKASFDDSALFRQGLMVLFHNPAAWADMASVSLKLMLPGNERAAMLLARDLMSLPDVGLYKQLGVYLGDLDDIARTGSTALEETYASRWVRGLPWIRPSERAYSTALYKARYDMMETSWKQLEASLGRKLDLQSNELHDAGMSLNPFRPGMKKMTDRQRLETIATWINDSTGRGKIWHLDNQVADRNAFKAAILDLSNVVFWSPRFFTSRIRFFPSAINASRAMGKSPMQAVANQLAYSMARWAVTSAGILLTCKYMIPGVDADLNWKSTSFGKVTAWNTRFDIFMGMGPLARAVIGLIVEQETSTGEIMPKDVNEILKRFITAKFSPVGSAALQYAPNLQGKVGQGYFGEDAHLINDMMKPVNEQGNLFYQLFMPMFIESLHDAYQTIVTPMVPRHLADALGIPESEPKKGWESYSKMLLSAGSEFFGISASTYLNKEDITEELKELTDMAEDVKYKDLTGGGGFTERGVVGKGTVRDIQRARDTARGETSTQGVSGELTRLKFEEQNEINNIATIRVTIGNDTKSVNEWINMYHSRGLPVPIAVRRSVTSKFFQIRHDSAMLRNDKLKEQKWAQPKTKEQKERMSFRQRIYEEWKESADTTRNADEYNEKLDALEARLVADGSAEALAALEWIHMERYTIFIPDTILMMLPETTRRKYYEGRLLRMKRFAADPSVRRPASGQ